MVVKKTKATGKGSQGAKGSLSKTRKAISIARKKGATTADIARAAMRDESTIARIEAGVIKKPPNDLAAKIKKAQGSKNKPTKKTNLNKKKAVASRDKHQ